MSSLVWSAQLEDFLTPGQPVLIKYSYNSPLPPCILVHNNIHCRMYTQVPDITDYTMVNRTYRYFEGIPLFPFGYGLYACSVYNFLLLKIPAFIPADHTPLLSFLVWRLSQPLLKLVKMWQWVLLWQILGAELLMRYCHAYNIMLINRTQEKN